ncbi:hypothetical protein SLEP1_g46933 [Rubroshorea leprosula]|uniref:F-box associated beta-propeller type 1 domain-containing protein n=1 Tax=Rubroshorea leprosula TaxID=152421 RepID=A0AAV5LNZ5_9ROSI|nr:hypothetical protein SLEP1_g46933 [Rubroshorea leprosula]
MWPSASSFPEDFRTDIPFEDGRSTVVDLPSPLERDDRRRLRIVGSCNGLVCLGLPPETAQSYRNLVHRPGYLYAPGFGYESASDDYKLVLATYYRESISVYMVMIATAYHWDGYFPESTFLNGAVHWRSRIGDDNTLTAFDLEKVTFFQVPIPRLPCSRMFFPYNGMGVLGGCLSLMIANSENSHPFGLWVMKEHRVEASWTKVLHLLNPDDYVPRGMHEIFYEPLCISGDNAFIFIGNTRELMKFSERGQILEKVSVCDDSNKCEGIAFVESIAFPNNP